MSIVRSAVRWQLLILTLGAALVLPAAAHATPTWLTAINISDPGQDGFEPQVVVAPDGTVTAVWTRSDGTNFRIQSANRTPNGPWSAAQTVSPAGMSASGPALAVDSSGDVVAAWSQNDGTNLRINAAFQSPGPGQSFGAPTVVSDPGHDASNVSVSMDNSGNALTAWERSDGTNLRVQTATRSPGSSGSFGAITTLSDPGFDGFNARAAAGPSVDANGVIVWTRSDGTNLRVQAARRRDVPGFPRPKGASPLRAALVPAFNQCTTANTVHGAPLAFPSCNPPTQSSSIATVGTPDANASQANFSGNVKFVTLSSDVSVSVSLTDIRNNPSLTDYTGPLQLRTSVQITDQSNAQEAPSPGTVQSFNYTAPVTCTSTVSTTIGSNCTLSTTVNALVPGTVVSGRRAIWELGQIQIWDPGPDGTFGDADDAQFLRQGIFVP